MGKIAFNAIGINPRIGKLLSFNYTNVTDPFCIIRSRVFQNIKFVRNLCGFKLFKSRKIAIVFWLVVFRIQTT